MNEKPLIASGWGKVLSIPDETVFTPNGIVSRTLLRTEISRVRPIPCSIKHGLIIKTWLALPLGDHFILLNDHDPVPLYYQFSAQWPGAFTWEHLVKGPDEFRVKITKIKASVETVTVTECCGNH